MSLRSSLSTAFSAIAITALVLVSSGTAHAAPPPPPAVMAALGDSITQAQNSCGYKLCPTNSWASGTSTTVNSHATRLKPASPSLVVYNNSVSGVTSAGLLAQAQKAVAQNAGYVTIQVGANDACTSTVAGMTATATYEANVKAAVTLIASSLPSAEIYVTSVPNLKTLWNVSKSKLGARLIWSAARVCQSMLANPTSTKAADNQRRDAVQARVTEYNAALARVCGPIASCTYDQGAVATFAFTSSHISSYDYFHPSVAGQAKLSEITWAKSPYVVG